VVYSCVTCIHTGKGTQKCEETCQVNSLFRISLGLLASNVHYTRPHTYPSHSPRRQICMWCKCWSSVLSSMNQGLRVPQRRGYKIRNFKLRWIIWSYEESLGQCSSSAFSGVEGRWRSPDLSATLLRLELTGAKGKLGTCACSEGNLY
jgi:hypothetical protein